MKKSLAFIVSFALLLIVATGFVSFPRVASHQVHAQQYAECISSAAAPACQSAQYGMAAIAASAQTVTVYTAAVTNTAIITVGYDQSIGGSTLLNVTCNTTAQAPYVSARSAGSSFTIKTGSTFSTNPGCVTWRILNQ